MRVPEARTPCIFIGPGTGIAPMRALIEERAKLDAKGTKVTYTVDAGDLLVFGNRNRAKDYLFEEEWARFRSSHDLAILTAFSQDGPPNEKKTYVQDVIARQGKQ